jgi:tetratricopeptide (TPR) repeat protein
MKRIRAFINERRFYILSFAAIFFLIFLTYRHTGKFDFIGLDDTTIISNRVADTDSISKIKNFLTQPVFDEADSLFYRPLLNLSFAIDTVISGGEMGFYHFSNIMIHAAAAFLLFIFLLSFNYSKPASVTASLIFAGYPVLVSAVVWIPGRNDSLLAIFVFLSFIFFIKNANTGNLLYAVLAAFSILFAALTKETAAIIPAALLLYLFLYGKPCKRNILTVLIITVFAFSIYALLRTYVISHGSSSLDPVKMTLNFLHSLNAYFWYSEVIFFLKKTYLYPNNLPISCYDAIIGFIPFISLVAIAAAFRKKINFKHIFFGLAWYFLFLSPTIVTRTGTYFNHRLYLPIAGIFIILIELTAAAPAKLQKILFTFFMITSVLFAFASHNASFYYKDVSSFWLNAYRQNPLSPTAALETSAHYKRNGDLKNAEKYLFEALELNGSGLDTKLLLAAGDFYFYKKEDDKAFEYYAKAEEKNKYNEYIYLGLSARYEMLRDKEKALAELERGLAVIPKSRLLAKRVKILRGEIPDDSYVIVMKAD